MADNRHFYWLKLMANFFDVKAVKKLETLEDGAKLVLLYIEMLLRSVETCGVLAFDGLEDDPLAEIALDLGADPALVHRLCDFLEKARLAEKVDTGYALFYAQENLGIETNMAGYMRKHRATRKINAEPDHDLQREPDVKQCNNIVKHCNNNVTHCKPEIESESESESELETDGVCPPAPLPAADDAVEVENSCPYDRIVSLFNEKCHRIGKVERLSPARKSVLDSLWNTANGLDSFSKVFEKVSNCRFFTGGSPSGWRPNFDWIVAPDHFFRILEGGYDDFSPPSSGSFDTDDFFAAALEKSYGSSP